MGLGWEQGNNTPLPSFSSASSLAFTAPHDTSDGAHVISSPRYQGRPSHLPVPPPTSLPAPCLPTHVRPTSLARAFLTPDACHLTHHVHLALLAIPSITFPPCPPHTCVTHLAGNGVHPHAAHHESNAGEDAGGEVHAAAAGKTGGQAAGLLRKQHVMFLTLKR